MNERARKGGSVLFIHVCTNTRNFLNFKVATDDGRHFYTVTAVCVTVPFISSCISNILWKRVRLSRYACVSVCLSWFPFGFCCVDGFKLYQKKNWTQKSKIKQNMNIPPVGLISVKYIFLSTYTQTPLQLHVGVYVYIHILTRQNMSYGTRYSFLRHLRILCISLYMDDKCNNDSNKNDDDERMSHLVCCAHKLICIRLVLHTSYTPTVWM